MIDFACRQFNLNDIIKCGLSLTRKEIDIFHFFILHKGEEHSTNELARSMKLNLTTIQKAVKKLYEKKIILRHQKNLENGGYIYTYECNSKKEIQKVLKDIIKNWSCNVEKAIDRL